MEPRKILIADDDTALLHALSCRLEHEGFKVYTTEDGYQALAIARREIPDLLILDISMPAGSGFSVCQRIQAIEEITDVPVIFITGHDTDAVYSKAESLGASTVLQKPFETDQLLSTVRKNLSKSVA